MKNFYRAVEKRVMFAQLIRLDPVIYKYEEFLSCGGKTRDVCPTDKTRPSNI